MLARILLPLLLLPAAAAQVIHVPGEFPDPQAAIAGVSAGATIVVHGGTWLPITIDKPLTLVGLLDGSSGGRPLFLPDGPPPVAQSPITLAGPGSGVVRLVNVELGGQVTAFVYSACDPSISGGGFAALHVFDSLVAGAPWDLPYNTVFPGADAIDVDVPLLWVERSVVRGADAGAGSNATQSLATDAGDGITCTGTVVLLDSSARGGDGPTASWDAGGAGGCPAVCPGGSGGDGVAAQSLIRSNSTVAPGTGMKWLDEDGVLPCCVGPAGTALLVGSELVLANDVSASGPPVLGQRWTLSWSLPGPAAVLFVSAGVGPAGQVGATKLHLMPPLFLGIVLPAAGSLPTTLPADASLTGVEFGVQLYSTAGWSRPVAGVFTP